jgi:hypothetical protein
MKFILVSFHNLNSGHYNACNKPVLDHLMRILVTKKSINQGFTVLSKLGEKVMWLDQIVCFKMYIMKIFKI